jgi:ATP-dependent Clp protease protease subunit
MSTPEPIRLSEQDEDKEGDKGLTAKMLKARTILVSEVVSDKLYRRVVSQLVLLEQDNPTATINVYVNSPGGSADSGFAVYDMLRFVRSPIRTVCTGLCASAAVLIYLSAPRERRYSLPNSRFLLHQPSTQLFGAASDIEINANEILRLRESYNRIVSEQTGRPVDQITRDSDRDFWLSAANAVEYGLVGRIVTKSEEMK